MKRLTLLLVAAATAACGLAESGLGTTPGADGGAEDVTVPPSDAGGDGGPGQDATATDAGAGDAQADAFACPSNLEGPSLALVDGYCIDSTEVTRDEYAKYLLATDGGASTDTRCAWKSGFDPGDWSSQTNPSNPVVEVDWCDAFEYCAWAKKRLCGARDGGAMAWTEAPATSNDRWWVACSMAGAKTYAYGSTWDSARCNDDGNGSGVVAVESYTQCVGGYPGLWDMTGNAKEWIDQCDPSGNPDNDDCHVIGGDYNAGDTSARCFDTETHQRNNAGDDGIGFRCCWP